MDWRKKERDVFYGTCNVSETLLRGNITPTHENYSFVRYLSDENAPVDLKKSLDMSRGTWAFGFIGTGRRGLGWSASFKTLEVYIELSLWQIWLVHLSEDWMWPLNPDLWI